jgi:hypothetical protein
MDVNIAQKNENIHLYTMKVLQLHQQVDSKHNECITKKTYTLNPLY